MLPGSMSYKNTAQAERYCSRARHNYVTASDVFSL